MAKYGEKAHESVERAMHKRKEGTLRSGSGGKVKSREQAIAIGLSEAREKGAKVPPQKSEASSKSRRGSSKSKSASSRSKSGSSKSRSSSRSSSPSGGSRKSSARSKS